MHAITALAAALVLLAALLLAVRALWRAIGRAFRGLLGRASPAGGAR